MVGVIVNVAVGDPTVGDAVGLVVGVNVLAGAGRDGLVGLLLLSLQAQGRNKLTKIMTIKIDFFIFASAFFYR